jgi:hypothetical protein
MSKRGADSIKRTSPKQPTKKPRTDLHPGLLPQRVAPMVDEMDIVVPQPTRIESTSPIEIIPDEVLQLILSFLPMFDRQNARLVSKLWAAQSDSPFIWKSLFEKYFRYVPLKRKGEKTVNYKNAFLQEYQNIKRIVNLHLGMGISVIDITTPEDITIPPKQGTFGRHIFNALEGNLNKLKTPDLDILKCIAILNGHWKILSRLSKPNKNVTLKLAAGLGLVDVVREVVKRVKKC